MGLLGLDFLESKQEKKLKDDAYNRLFFPYGDIQKNKIIEILASLFPNETKENTMYNYIVTKQKIMDLELYRLNKEELNNLACALNESYITEDNNAKKYIVLAYFDINITQDLSYPSIEEINLEEGNLFGDR